MKTPLFALILAIATHCQIYGADLFREVAVGTGSWEVVFHEQGGRYLIEIDSVERGTSGYLQRLRLLSQESLRLIDKHAHMAIRPVDRDGKKGIEITSTYRDPVTGNPKVETTFEPNHSAKSDRAGNPSIVPQAK